MKIILIIFALCVAMFGLRYLGFFILPIVAPVVFVGGCWIGYRVGKWVDREA